MMPTSNRMPDLSDRPYGLTIERVLPLSATTIFNAWTKGFDLWFAAPGSVLMQGEVNTTFFFETEFKPEANATAKRHPHYGRFLRVIPNQLIQLTWVTGTGGTEGAETVVTVELKQEGSETTVRLSHEGFSSPAARDGHEHAWPMVLEHMEQKLAAQSSI
jgi:uncharacterized protein YndB with AHSA1/START domain